MLAVRTIIGLVVGSLVIGLGAFALVNSLAPTISMNENFVISPGDSEFFTIPAPVSYTHLTLPTTPYV